MKRIFALIFSVLFIVTLFSACNKDKGGDASTTASVDSNPEVLSVADVNFKNADGTSHFNVVRPASATETESACANDIFWKLSANFSVSPKSVTDESEENTKGPSILIGNTNCAETASAIKELDSKSTGRYNEYIICTMGEDIVIWARDDSTLRIAVDLFISQYLSSETVKGGIYTVHTANEGFVDVTVFGKTNLSDVKIVRPIYNISYIVQLEIEKLMDDVMHKSGFKFGLVEDQVASKTGSVGGTLTEANNSEYEIIVGNCVRDGVRGISDKNQYEIRIEDKKIYLNGGSPSAIAMAVSEFGKMLLNKKVVTSADTITSGNYNSAIGSYDTASKYTLTWGDDFDGTKIDTSKWVVKWDYPAYVPDGDGKVSYRGSSKHKNNYVKGGKLYMDAIETPEAYYGGLITNQGIFQYRYGYTEISTLHPKGQGLWEALYTMSATSPDDVNNVDVWLAKGNDQRIYYSETDIDESYSNVAEWCWTHVHAQPTRATKIALGLDDNTAGNINPAHKTYALDDRGLWMDFHTYGYEWFDNQKVTFFIDGKKVHEIDFTTFADPAPFLDAFSQAVFMRVGLAIGTTGNPEQMTDQEWAETNKYIIDYIHVYQLRGQQYYYNKNGWKEYTVK